MPHYDPADEPPLNGEPARFTPELNFVPASPPTPIFEAVDEDLLEVDSAPTLAEFTNPAVRRLRSHLRFLDTNPSLAELSAQAQQILETLELVSELPDVLDLTVAVLNKVYEPFERLELWQEWFPRLFNLYPMLVKHASHDKLIQWYESVIAHFIYVGNPSRCAAAVSGVRGIIASDEQTALQEARINLLCLVSTPGDYGQQAVEILRIVRSTRDLQLLARAYSLLAQRCYELRQLRLAFEFAQMTYCLGLELKNTTKIVDGLQLMANVGYLAGWEARTFEYLRRANQANAPTGDVAREAYLNLSWGAALLNYHHDEQAEPLLRYSAERLAGRGTYYAQALYLHGLTLTRLRQFDDAMVQLRAARDEYAIQKCHYETNMAEHALAHLYHVSGQPQEAVMVIEHVITDLETLTNVETDARAAYLLPIVREDAAMYRSARDESIPVSLHD